MKKHGWLLVSVLAVCSLVLYLSACGGGDDGGSDSGSESSPDLTPAGLDTDISENVLALTLAGGELGDFSWSWIDDSDYRSAVDGSATTGSVVDWALKHAHEAILSGSVAEHDESRSGSSSESGSCEDSGTYQIRGSWAGPDSDDIEDICDISDMNLTMTYTDCQELGERINGTIQIQIVGNFCAPTSMSVAFNAFSLYDSGSGMQVEFDDFDIAMTDIEMTADMEDILHVRQTMNGDCRIDSLSMEYYQYTEDVTVNGSDSSITVNGYVAGGCFDGWVTVTTLSPVLVNNNSECPHGGNILLSGTSDMPVVFNSDGSLTIGEESYDSCADLPDICQ